jgi:uncharacterized protein YerC
MTTPSTVRRVPDARPASEEDAQAIRDAMKAIPAAQLALEKAVAQALKNGASIRGVEAATGLSQNTIQKYGRAHGWPTQAHRDKFYETRWDKSQRDKGTTT